jgi:hypothetical protein
MTIMYWQRGKLLEAVYIIARDHASYRESPTCAAAG